MAMFWVIKEILNELSVCLHMESLGSIPYTFSGMIPVLLGLSSFSQKKSVDFISLGHKQTNKEIPRATQELTG